MAGGGRRGLAHLAALADFPDLSKTEVFVCDLLINRCRGTRCARRAVLAPIGFSPDAFSIVKPANELEVSCLP